MNIATRRSGRAKSICHSAGLHLPYRASLGAAGIRHVLRRWASFSRVVTFDKRGTGMSDRPGRISTLEERMDDIRAVMDACKVERAVILGVSEGPRSVDPFRRHLSPRTRALILIGGHAPMCNNLTTHGSSRSTTPAKDRRCVEDAPRDMGHRGVRTEAIALGAPSAKMTMTREVVRRNAAIRCQPGS